MPVPNGPSPLPPLFGLYLREIGSGPSRGPFMTDPNPNLDPDEVDEGEQARDRVPGSGVARGGSPRSPTLAGLVSWRLSEG